MRDFKKIIAWQKADDVTVALYEVTRSFPREERYAMVPQMRRSAYSVPANIAEGASRSSKKDYLHFLYVARGSSSELCYFIHLSNRLGYLNDEVHARIVTQTDEAARVLTGLIQSVEKEAGLLHRVTAKATAALTFALALNITKLSGL
jgi:four helix bundle protein